MTGAPAPAAASIARSTSRVRTPPASAISLARWMTGPSMTGSEYGNSTSTTSTPDSTIARIAAMLPGTVGNPAGMQPISTPRPSAFAFSNAGPTFTWPPRVPLGSPVHARCRAPGSSHVSAPGAAPGEPKHAIAGARSRLLLQKAEVLRGGLAVLVAAAGQVDDDDRVRPERRGEAQRAGEGMRALDCRDDPLGAAQPLERGHRLRVGHPLGQPPPRY